MLTNKNDKTPGDKIEKKSYSELRKGHDYVRKGVGKRKQELRKRSFVQTAIEQEKTQPRQRQQ